LGNVNLKNWKNNLMPFALQNKTKALKKKEIFFNQIKDPKLQLNPWENLI